MSERLEDIKRLWEENNDVPNDPADYEWLIQQAERVEESERRNQELEYASKYNGELNEFLQRRSLPPNTLGRHVVDVAMNYVEVLEDELYDLKKSAYQTQMDFLETNGKKNTLLEQNQRYKQALEFASNELYQAYITGDIVNKENRIREVMERVDEALEGESQ